MLKLHPVAIDAPRNERRMLLKQEQKARKTGQWGPWERVETPPGFGLHPKKGWTFHVTHAWRNGVFCVLDRPLPNGGRHFAITSLSQERPTWWEMQRIKNELAGPDTLGVEIYPPTGDVVDAADMYHLWIVVEPMDAYSIAREPRA